MKKDELSDTIIEETKNVVIDLAKRREEKKQKERIKKIILDSIESHAVSLIVGIPEEQADQIKYGMAEHGNKFLVRLIEYMFEVSSRTGSPYRMLQHLRDMHSEDKWPTFEEQLEAFSVGIQSALDDYYGDPEEEEEEVKLKLVDDEEDLEEKLVLKPGAEGWDKYAQLVGEAYLNAPSFEQRAVPHYKALVPFIENMFNQIQSRVEVEFVDFHPYENAEQLRREVADTGILKVAKLDSEHAVFSPLVNWKFRAVHDYMAHIQAIGSRGTEFSLSGELAAYNAHLKTVPRMAIPALFTEVVGQVCAYYHQGGKFAEQKIVLLDGFDYINVGEVEGRDVKNKELNEDELEEISLDKDIGGHHSPDEDYRTYVRSNVDPIFTTKDIERILYWKNKNEKDQSIRNNEGFRDEDGERYKFSVRHNLFYTGVKTMNMPCCVIADRNGGREFLWYDEGFNEVIMKIQTYKPNQMDKGNPNVAVVEWTNAAEHMRGKGFAYACYKTLVVDLNLILMSDTTQSEGSMGVWKKFINDKDIVATVEYKSDRNEKMYSSITADEEGNVDSDVGDPWIDPQEIVDYTEQIHGKAPDMYAFNKAGSYVSNPEYVKWKETVDNDKELQQQIRYHIAARKSKIYIYSKQFSKSKQMVPDFSS
jgi:hypothetical protein